MGRPIKRRSNRRRVRSRRSLPPPRAIGAALLAVLGRQRRLLIAAAIASLIAAAVAGGHAWLTRSPRFAIHRVDVRGAEMIPASALAARLAVDRRPNLFLYDTAAAVARLEASPWIRAASIYRKLPDGLVVEISEKRPAALLVAGALYLIDETGAIFKRATTAEAVALELVAITGFDRETIAADPAATSELLRRAISLARQWQQSSRPALGEINVDPVRGFTLITRDRAIAVRAGVGSDDEVDERLALFDRAWAALEPEERARVAMVHLDQSSSPRRASVAFERETETSSWPN